LLLGLGVGCSSARFVTLRSVPDTPLAESLQLTSRRPRPSQRSMQFLRVNDLAEDLDGDPQQLLGKVQAILAREPSAENVYIFAELSYLEAHKVEGANPRLALDLYGAAVLHSYQYLFDDRFARLRNPYDPQFRGACDLYNAALEAGLRRVCKDNGLAPNKTYALETAAGSWDITCVLRGGAWRPEDFGRFEFVSDYEMTGLKNHYQTYGLGVPLIAVRRSYPGEPAAARYYPPGLSFPVTAFLRPIDDSGLEQGATGMRRRGVLELYDSLSTIDTPLGRAWLPLESDLTTPLAYFLSNPQLGQLANAALLRPDLFVPTLPGSKRPIMGLYMVQPYEAGKIPVVMVHGLWSSPMTWMEMFNDLRSSPDIREHYQFWFYLYPTGQPFWISAAQMRKELAELREVLDPQHQQPALDQMILIGHSMGGLVSWLQTLYSGDRFWGLVSDKPLAHVRADASVLALLRDSFFFRPNPSIRRVVTIATPHRGSNFSNFTPHWLFSAKWLLPTALLQDQERLFRENPDMFSGHSLLRIETSIDSLAPTTPIFPAMLSSPHLPGVRYHNILGRVPRHGLYTLTGDGDGVVTAESAHAEDAASELVVPSDHLSVHCHPRAVLEVRRILLEHLAELSGAPPGLRTSGERMTNDEARMTR
jgi:pimeloyl-ACP methyl ester carboxylesterase